MTDKKVKKKIEVIKSHTMAFVVAELSEYRKKYRPTGAVMVETHNHDGIAVFIDGVNQDEVIHAMLTFIRDHQRHESDKIKDKADET